MRRSRRKETNPAAAAFIEGAHHGHATRTQDRGGKEQPSPTPPPGEKLKAPTPSDSHTHRTRALISQVKRRVQTGYNGTAVSTPHAQRLKRSALKRYVRAVPSRASRARPPIDQGRRAVSIGHRLRLARPLADPEQKSARWFPSGADSVSPDPNTTIKSKNLPR